MLKKLALTTSRPWLSRSPRPPSRQTTSRTRNPANYTSPTAAPSNTPTRPTLFPTIHAMKQSQTATSLVAYVSRKKAVARTGDFFALQIRGASMEPVLYEGDIVIVRKQPTAENGDTTIVLINGDEATVKKIKRETSGIMLIGNNTAVYEPHFYSNEETCRSSAKSSNCVGNCKSKRAFYKKRSEHHATSTTNKLSLAGAENVP